MTALRGATLLPACALLAIALTLAACKPSPVVEQRRIVLHAPAACRVPGDAYAYLYGAGEFQPRSDAPPEEGHLAGALDVELAKLPASTRQLVADVSTSAASSLGAESTWRGLAPVSASGPVDLLLWPDAASCPLTASVGERTRSSMIAIDARHVLVTAGSGNPVPPSYLVDLGNGSVTRLTADGDLGTPREGFSATPFAATADSADSASAARGVVVAGGADATSHDVRNDAEIFDVGAAAFRKERIVLSGPRSEHGAVMLAGGATLLAGGVARAGGPALASLEIVDVASTRARTAGLATLAVARRNPTLLRLASGEILVAGGVDTNGNPVAALEWLAPDASRSTRRAQNLVATPRRAFIALPGGGALAVIAPVVADPTFENVWVISAEGAIESAARLVLPPGELHFFEGSGGAPLLWDGARFQRWQPWAGSFTPAFFDVAAPRGPTADVTTIASPDRGLALWLDRDRVVGLRFDTTGPFTTLARPLLRDDLARLAPDRLVTSTTQDRARFDKTRGLALAKDVTVFVTDLTFAGLDLSVATEPGHAPSIVLRDAAHAVDYVIGLPTAASDVACPLPPATSRIDVVRREGKLTVAVDDGAAVECPRAPPATARLSIGLRGALEGTTSTARDLTVRRTGE